jgi:septin family protein
LLNSGNSAPGDTVADLRGSVTLDNMWKLNRPEAVIAKKGAATDFNILVCGAAGIGKSSFVELFIKKFNLAEANVIIKAQEQCEDL